MTIKEYDPDFFEDEDELEKVMYSWGWGKFTPEGQETVKVRRHHFNIIKELYKMNTIENNGVHPLAQWGLHSTYYYPDKDKACHCGQQHIKRISKIRNVYNDMVCDNIGSVCIIQAFSYNGIIEDTKAGVKAIDKKLRDEKKKRQGKSV